MALPLDWYSITSEALLEFWKGFLLFVPKFLGALFVFLIGWLFASGIGKLVKEILNKLKLNETFERTGWAEAFRKAESKIDPSEFLGAIVKWILVFIFLLASVEILGSLQFAVFLTKILEFLPNLVVAILIFVVAVILADILEKITVASFEKAKIGYSKLTGCLVRGSVLVFAILAILVQLGIAAELIITLFKGFVALFVISFGLAFGLGGKEIAAEILKELREKLR